MSALPSTPQVRLPVRTVPMTPLDLEEVFSIERLAYPHPWSLRNFADSLASGYRCQTLRDEAGLLIGYVLTVSAVDEVHLLNLTVRSSLHGQGYGRLLLDDAVAAARLEGMATMLLEVRPSNPRAIAIYQRYGFVRIGIRRGYYPAVNQTREDAIVMRLGL